jgi:hypothetical protein
LEEQNVVEKQKIKEKQKPRVKKLSTNLYNKFKRKRECEEDVNAYKVYKRRSLVDTSNMDVNFLEMIKTP